MNVAVVNAEKVEFGTYTLSFFSARSRWNSICFLVLILIIASVFPVGGNFRSRSKTSWKTFGQDLQFFFEDKPIIVGNIEQR
jgi:fumarate reductase subunit D